MGRRRREEPDPRERDYRLHPARWWEVDSLRPALDDPARFAAMFGHRVPAEEMERSRLAQRAEAVEFFRGQHGA